MINGNILIIREISIIHRYNIDGSPTWPTNQYLYLSIHSVFLDRVILMTQNLCMYFRNSNKFHF